MVSSLKYRKRDPMYPFKNRGPGFYYYRGRGHWSKWSPSRDKLRISRGNDPRHIGSGKWRHTHDIVSRIVRRIKEHVKRKSRRVESKEKRLKRFRRRHAVLAAPFEKFWIWLSRKWSPIKARAFTLKLQREARERGLSPHSIDVDEMWEKIGEHIDVKLGVSEAFNNIYDRISGFFGGFKNYVMDEIEELERQLESIEHQIAYGDLTEEMRHQLECARRDLISRIHVLYQNRKYRRKRR